MPKLGINTNAHRCQMAIVPTARNAVAAIEPGLAPRLVVRE
jgi:hypothetical protein